MKNILLAALVALGVMFTVNTAFAQSADVNGDGCVTKVEAIDGIVAATSPGTKVEFEDSNMLAFSNPNETTYFVVIFDAAGCAISSDVVDPAQFNTNKSM